jgi:hypothetical protein
MISKCPKCRKTVSVPSGVDASDVVRCPLCCAEYPLSESLALAPPELIPVVVPAVQHAVAVAAAAEAAEPVTVSEPTGAAEEPQHEPEVENEAASVAEQFSTTPVGGRRRKKPKSALQTIIEVIAGGLAGCLVAYYGLAFYYGPEFAAKGLPQLPLPGIEWITAPRPDAGDAKEKPTDKDKKPAKGKSKAAGNGGEGTHSRNERHPERSEGSGMEVCRDGDPSLRSG